VLRPQQDRKIREAHRQWMQGFRTVNARRCIRLGRIGTVSLDGYPTGDHHLLHRFSHLLSSLGDSPFISGL
ncbi:hypothetical protein M8C21_009452, partial [Ambrosia artemisiifolia]